MPSVFAIPAVPAAFVPIRLPVIVSDPPVPALMPPPGVLPEMTLRSIRFAPSDPVPTTPTVMPVALAVAAVPAAFKPM
jgi:hypothetical protein